MKQQKSSEGKSLSFLTKATLGLALAGSAVVYMAKTAQDQLNYTLQNNCEIERGQVEEGRKTFVPVSSNGNQIEGLFLNEEDLHRAQIEYTQKSEIISKRDSLLQAEQTRRENIREEINNIDGNIREFYKRIVGVEDISGESFTELFNESLDVSRYGRISNNGYIFKNENVRDEVVEGLKEQGLVSEEHLDHYLGLYTNSDEFYAVRYLSRLHRNLYASSTFEDRVQNAAAQEEWRVGQYTTSEEQGFLESRLLDQATVQGLTFQASDYEGQGIPEDARNCDLGPVTSENYHQISQALQKETGEEVHTGTPLRSIRSRYSIQPY